MNDEVKRAIARGKAEAQMKEFGALSGNRWTWRVRERTEAEKEAMKKAQAIRQMEATKAAGKPVLIYVVVRNTILSRSVLALPTAYPTRDAAQLVCGANETVRELQVML